MLKDKGTGTGGHPTPTPQPFLFSGRVSSRTQAGLIRSKPLMQAGLGRCRSEAKATDAGRAGAVQERGMLSSADTSCFLLGVPVPLH